MASSNHFIFDDKFFVIDSNNLDYVTTKLYGYVVSVEGIISGNNDNKDIDEEILTGRGCYIYIKADQNNITIKQDFIGSWGLYLYKYNDYFAISNSFQELAEYVKNEFPISFNRNFANHMIIMELASLSLEETLINEIKLLSKNSIVSIDIVNKTLYIEEKDYQEETLSLNSEEGIRTLDHWFDTWTTIIRRLKDRTDNISVALSGGFDSRLTFLLTLQSGIDLDSIRVNSINASTHTFSEDFKIASEIAEYYGFKLNNKLPSGNQYYFDMDSMIKLAWKIMIPFHQEIYFKYQISDIPQFSIEGFGGEAIRAHWKNDFGESVLKRATRFSNPIAEEIRESTNLILQKACNAAKGVFLDKNELPSIYSLMYRLTRIRSHFGKAAVNVLFTNTYVLMPLIDPDLYKLKLIDPICPDTDLIMALIYVRYCPKLLEFSFEGSRSISKSAIEYAQYINKQFPIPMFATEDFETSFKISSFFEKKYISYLKNNMPVKIGEPVNYLFQLFCSSVVKGVFLSQFDEEIYEYANDYYKTSNYYPIRYCGTVVAISKYLLDIYENGDFLHQAGKDYFDFLIRSSQRNTHETNADIIARIKEYFTARIDFTIKNAQQSDFELLRITDERARCSYPGWMQKNGTGMMIESYRGSLDIMIRSHTEGKIAISLKGIDKKGENGERVPRWVDYTSFSYNGINIFDEKKAAWHDKPINYMYPIFYDEVIRIHIEWNPCSPDLADMADSKEQINDESCELLKKQLVEKAEELSCISGQLSSVRHENEKMKAKQKDFIRQEKKLKNLEIEYLAIKGSFSYRLGRLILWPARKIRSLFKTLFE